MSVSAHVAGGDARQPDHRERHTVVEHPDMPRMDEKRLSRRQLVGRHLTGEFDPGLSLALELLEDEAFTTPQAATERLLECHRGRNAGCAAYPAVAMDDVPVARADLDREDPAGDLAGEAHHPGAARRLVASEEQAPAHGHALEAGHDPTITPGVGGLGELHVGRHP